MRGYRADDIRPYLVRMRPASFAVASHGSAANRILPYPRETRFAGAPIVFLKERGLEIQIGGGIAVGIEADGLAHEGLRDPEAFRQ